MEPKVSWLKHFGKVMGRILHLVAADAQPVIDKAAMLASIILPQFSAEIQLADGIATRIVKQIIVTEAVKSGLDAATTGADKLAHAVAGVGSEIDQWVANMFPGAAKVSELGKSGLVSALTAIVNEQQVSSTSSVVPVAPVAPAPVV